MEVIMKLSRLFAAAVLLSASLAFAAEPKTVFTVVRPTPWGAHNLNPYTQGDQHLLPTLSALYETLFVQSALDGKVTEVLGTKYEWSKDATTLVVTTRDGVKWSDGQAFSAKDVVFSFNLIKKFPALDLAGLWKNGLVSVTAEGNKVTFKFDAPNTPVFQYVAHTPIVAEHAWKDVADPVTFQNQKPVVTGPFVFDTYSPQALRVLKNPTYWMKGKPAIDAVVWLSTANNEAAVLKLLKDEADFGFIAVPDPKAGYADKGPNLKYWWPVQNDNFLFLNTTKAPLDDVGFRRALAQAIDLKDVALKGYAGVVSPAHLSGLIPAQHKAWLPDSAKGLELKFDPAAADKALVAAGYKLDADGKRLGKDGKPLPELKILVGSGWTDYITMAQVVSENLKKVGIPSIVDQQVWASYSSGFRTGNFDMGISWGWGSGPTPYYLYYGAFSPENTKPVGEDANNFTRWSSPEIGKALTTFKTNPDPKAQKAAIAAIVTAVMKDVPWIPLTDRSQFELHNTSRFSGFPSDADQYNDGPADDAVSTRLMFLNLKAK
jgi:peptide/nickel transport system substrate-binding protein